MNDMRKEGLNIVTDSLIGFFSAPFTLVIGFYQLVTGLRLYDEENLEQAKMILKKK